MQTLQEILRCLVLVAVGVSLGMAMGPRFSAPSSAAIPSCSVASAKIDATRVIQVSSDGGDWCDFPAGCSDGMEINYLRVLVNPDKPTRRYVSDVIVARSR